WATSAIRRRAIYYPNASSAFRLITSETPMRLFCPAEDLCPPGALRIDAKVSRPSYVMPRESGASGNHGELWLLDRPLSWAMTTAGSNDPSKNHHALPPDVGQLCPCQPLPPGLAEFDLCRLERRGVAIHAHVRRRAKNAGDRPEPLEIRGRAALFVNSAHGKFATEDRVTLRSVSAAEPRPVGRSVRPMLLCSDLPVNGCVLLEQGGSMLRWCLMARISGTVRLT